MQRIELESHGLVLSAEEFFGPDEEQLRTVEPLWEEAIRAYKGGDHELAQKLFADAIRKANPAKVPDCYSNLAAFFYINGDLESAVANFKLAIEVLPKSRVLHYSLAKVYAEQHKLCDALRHYKLSLHSRSNSFPSRRLVLDEIEKLRKLH